MNTTPLSMLEFKKLWKSLKERTLFDMFNYALIKAIKSKNEDKELLTMIFLSKAFTPISNKNKLVTKTPFKTLEKIISSIKNDIFFERISFFGKNIDEILNKDEFVIYKNLIIMLSETDLLKLNRYYCYIFLDKKYGPEISMVQSSHVAMVVGKNMNKKFNPHNIFYQIVEKPNELNHYNLEQKHNKFKFHYFIEPDLNNEIIASAINPIPWYKTTELKEYPLVTF